MKVAISGATGLIGSALAASLAADGHQVLHLVRRAALTPGEVEWYPETGDVEAHKLAGVDAVVHLAALPLGPRRWTPDRRRRISSSRVMGTRTIAAALAGMAAPPPRLLCASAVGYYGDTGITAVDERSPQGTGFLAGLVAEWEAATGAAEQAGISVAHLRTGLVLAAHGGLLGTMLPLFRLGLGGRLGSGKQYMSWITLADEVSAIRFLLLRPDITGPVNLGAPEPVTNAEFTQTLARALHRPAKLPVPRAALRAAFGDFADEAALASQRVLPVRLHEAGYVFDDSHLDTALAHILKP